MNGPWCVPFDGLPLVPTAVGFHDYNLPGLAQGLGRDNFFEPFQPPRKISVHLIQISAAAF